MTATRILLVNTLYHPYQVGGAEKSVQELAESLVADGAAVAVATLVPREVGGAAPPAYEVINGVEVHRHVTSALDVLLARRPGTALRRAWLHVRHWGDIGAYRFLSRVAHDFPPDVVHTNNIGGFGVAGWLAVRRYPIVHTMRDYFLLCTNASLYRDGRISETRCRECVVLKAPFRAARSIPDVFVGISQDIVDGHRQLGFLDDGSRTHVVRNAPALRREIAARPHLSDPACVTFGFIGRVDERKGVWVVLDGFAAMADPDARLLIAGDVGPEDAAELKERVARDPRVTYLGRLPAEDFYDRVDVVLVSSLWREPFGRVAAEARLAGRYALYSPVGGIPEAIDGYALAWPVADFATPDAWRDQMQDLSTRIRSADVAPASSLLDTAPGRIVDRYRAVYDTAAKDPTHAR